jgi:F420-0:gamma-glutamyl ligase-like protein
MMGILTDPRGRFRFEPDVARELLDATWGRHLANEVVGTEFGPAVEELANHRRLMKSTLKITRAVCIARTDSGQ